MKFQIGLFLILLIALLGCGEAPINQIDDNSDGNIGFENNSILFGAKPFLSYSLGAGNYTFSATFGGYSRTMYVHVPKSYNRLRPTPLLIGYHGGGGTGDDFEAETHLDQKSESAGFIAVFPNAYSGTKKWNVGPRANPKDQPPTDDIAFTSQMIDYLKAKFNINSARIYTTGISDGGFMAFRTACDLTSKIAAVATVATTLMYHPCNPTKTIPIINIHGTADRLVPYNGGYMDPTLPESIKVNDYFRPQSEVINFWLSKNSCSYNYRVTYQNKSVTCYSTSSCANNVEFKHCIVNGGGHTWPGASCIASPSVCSWYVTIVGQYNYDMNANDVIWEFFSRYPR